MMQRRAVQVGVMWGVLLVCAGVTQSAAGAWTAAKHLTAFTCVKGAGKLDFADAHCDQAVTAGTGEYGHVAIPVGKTTEAETTNSTPAVLKATILGAVTKITCEKVHGTGTFQNEEPSAGVHSGKAVGSSKFSECVVNEPAGCAIAQPITTESTTGTPVEEGALMGGEIRPTSGTKFTNIKITGCAIAGTYPISGSAVAVGGAGATTKNTGSTAVYLAENENLTLGPEKASVTVTTAVQTVGGIPLAGTTVE
jgi:hypothetical protein